MLSATAVTTARRLRRSAVPALSKRETVGLSQARFQYQLEVLDAESAGSRPLGRLSAAIIPVRGGYRVRVDSFRDGRGNDGRGAYRVFCDSGDCPLSSREEAGRLYRQVIETAKHWLASELDVDLAALPARDSRGFLLA